MTWREDHFTHTEADAAAYEAMRADDGDRMTMRDLGPEDRLPGSEPGADVQEMVRQALERGGWVDR